MNNQLDPSAALVQISPHLGIISRIKYIRGVGRFRECKPQGDVALKKFTLLFGENGRGKTTLCSILRSLQTRHPNLISGRRTLGSSGDPQVVIDLGSGPAIFQSGAWVHPIWDTRIRIFDAHYVAENVYSGDAIGPDQRRNLCRIILGQQGVALANRYDEIDKEIIELNTTIRAARGIIISHAGVLKPEQFVELEPDPHIDEQIGAKAIEVEGLRQIDRLKGRAGLVAIELPPLPSQIESVLARTLDDVSRDAERIVHSHLASHNMAVRGEEWLTEGLSHVAGGACPFCGQSVQNLDLLKAYQTFFNESFRRLQHELSRYRATASHLYADEKSELLRSQLAGNITSADLWERYVPITRPRPAEFDQLAPIMTAFRDEMLMILDRKIASPLDAVMVPESYKAARDRLAALGEMITVYNQQVATANAAIESFKAKGDATRLQVIERELATLRIRKQRFEPSVQDACENFKAVNAAKAKAEDEKRQCRNELDTYSEAVLGRYQRAINDNLKHFTAGFHIDRVKMEYSGRVPNSTFCIVINDMPVEIGKHDAPHDSPCFRNTLSAGDRSTLALAFFFAELEEDPDKSRCIAVFDDPFTSQDQFRRTCTIGKIQRCGDEVAQVIVMSHDRTFLKAIWDIPLSKADRKALWLMPAGKRDTALGEWDIEGDTESEDAANRRVLLGFYHHPSKSDPRDVIQKLRPVAETHMFRLAPDHLADIKGLGNMIMRIRSVQAPVSLISALPDLTDINAYTRRYMHGENPNYASEPLSRDELHGFVGKILEIAGAMPG